MIYGRSFDNTSDKCYSIELTYFRQTLSFHVAHLENFVMLQTPSYYIAQCDWVLGSVTKVGMIICNSLSQLEDSI